MSGIVTDAAPKAVGAYPHARRVGNLLFLSGVGPRRSGDNSIPGNVHDEQGRLVSYDIDAQCRQVFANVRAVLEASVRASRRPLREVLLDQSVVAGVGNIYAIEACHRAGVHPLVAAHRLTAPAWSRLAIALRDVMRSAIDNGGTTLRDFRDVSGEAGHNQDELQVYGRAGRPCPRCGTELVAFVHAGRGGVFCPVDQPRPRGRIR